MLWEKRTLYFTERRGSFWGKKGDREQEKDEIGERRLLALFRTAEEKKEKLGSGGKGKILGIFRKKRENNNNDILKCMAAICLCKNK